MKLKDILNESGLSRIWQHMSAHDCGTISAFRKAESCGMGTPYSHSDNVKRNKSLMAKIFAGGGYGNFSVTSIRGKYIENFYSKIPAGQPGGPAEIAEDTFFIADIKDKGNLLGLLKRLGEEFEQDSILFIPKGGMSSELHGTNHCPTGYPGYGQKVIFHGRQLGQDGEFFSSVAGRPFHFSIGSSVSEGVGPSDFHGKWACSAISQKKWTELE